jgi:hypothetical protein
MPPLTGWVESRMGPLPLERSVSRPRSSNWTCGFPASSFPTRACRQLSQTTLAMSWTAARKLRAVFSHGSGFAGPRTGYAGGDRTELLDFGEEVLDQMALAVKRSVIVAQCGPVGPRRDHRLLASGSQGLKNTLVGVECHPPSQGQACRRSAYRPPSWAGGDRLPQGRALHRRSGKSRADCPAHRPMYGSWYSVHRASARSPGPRRLFLAPALC